MRAESTLGLMGQKFLRSISSAGKLPHWFNFDEAGGYSGMIYWNLDFTIFPLMHVIAVLSTSIQWS